MKHVDSWKDMQEKKSFSGLPFPLIYAFLLFLPSSFRRQRKKLPIVNPRGEAEDTLSCKTYALNIRAIKLVKLKAILENREIFMRLALDRGRFISGQRGPAGAQVTTVNRRGGGGDAVGLHALCVQPDVHMCDWVSPFQSARVANVGVSKERTSAPNYEKRRKKKERISELSAFAYV